MLIKPPIAVVISNNFMAKLKIFLNLIKLFNFCDGKDRLLIKSSFEPTTMSAIQEFTSLVALTIKCSELSITIFN
jgi:hypothetical protein